MDYNPDAYAYVKEEKYSDKNSEHFLSANAVLGASKWSKGLNEITYVPGGYADAVIVIEQYRTIDYGKLSVTICPPFKDPVVVSQKKARSFRHWLDLNRYLLEKSLKTSG